MEKENLNTICLPQNNTEHANEANFESIPSIFNHDLAEKDR